MDGVEVDLPTVLFDLDDMSLEAVLSADPDSPLAHAAARLLSSEGDYEGGGYGVARFSNYI